MILTAKELAYKSKFNNSGLIHFVDCVKLMNQFAKLHVEAALKAASEKAKTKNKWDGNTGSEFCDTVVDSESILNAYDLNQIK